MAFPFEPDKPRRPKAPPPAPLFEAPRFDGATFDPRKDQSRLADQATAVFAFMSDGQWHTLGEIEAATGAPAQSASARLRDFRKAKFGGHTVERRRRTADGGTFEYRLLVNMEAERR